MDIFVAPRKKEEDRVKERPREKGGPKAYGKKVGYFSSFCLKPTGVSFKDQDPDEVIYIFLRKHYITNLPWIFFSAILALIPPIVFLFGRGLPMPTPIPSSYFFIIGVFYYLIVITYIFISFFKLVF